MKKVVVDTGILVDYFRTGKGLFDGLTELQRKGEIDIYLSVITVFELMSGQTGVRDERILRKTAKYWKIIPIGNKLARLAARAKRNKRLVIALGDFFIGMSAKFINGYLVTRNKKHFEGIEGLRYYNIII